MKYQNRVVWACAAGWLGLAGSALGQVTGQIEHRFVVVGGLASSPNQGLIGLSSGTVLGPNTQVTPIGGTIRQRIALQMRAVNIAGTTTSQGFNSTFTGLVPGSTFQAQNLGIFAAGGDISMGDGEILSRTLNTGLFQGGVLTGTVVGPNWTNFQAVIASLAPQLTWPYQSPVPPPPPALPQAGPGGEWVSVAAFTWQTADVTPRTTVGTFSGIPGLARAYVGHGVVSVDFPSSADELDGAVLYTRLLSDPLTRTGSNFSFALQQNQSPVVATTPKQLVADPLVNPDAMSVVLASITDPEGQSVSASITDDGGIGLLGGMVSVEGNGSSSPLIVLTWDAPNSAIGQTFTVSFQYSDALNGPLTGTALVTVIPSPGALMVLGLGGIAAARRRRA